MTLPRIYRKYLSLLIKWGIWIYIIINPEALGEWFGKFFNSFQIEFYK